MRYSRQVMLPEIGETGQAKLKEARVLIVGVGGLGSPIALYLAGAGIGTIGLIDNDKVSISNLQRQILYTEADIVPKQFVPQKNFLLSIVKFAFILILHNLVSIMQSNSLRTMI